MKNSLIALIIFILIGNSASQVSLSLNFNKTFSGRNTSLLISKNINTKLEVGAGLRFNLNKLAHNDDQFNLYKDRLYVKKENPTQFFGVHAFCHRSIFNSWDCIKPFFFFDLQITYAATMNRYYYPFTYDSTGEPLYKQRVDYFGPFTWVEPTLGFGFKAKLYGNFYLQQKTGFGTTFILGKDQTVKLTWFGWSFGTLMNIGIGYRFMKKEN